MNFILVDTRPYNPSLYKDEIKIYCDLLHFSRNYQITTKKHILNIKYFDSVYI